MSWMNEYPRPQLQRGESSWLCLNGPWQYAITPLSQDTPPAAWDGIIMQGSSIAMVIIIVDSRFLTFSPYCLHFVIIP